MESLRKLRGTKIDAGLKVLQGPMTVKLNNLSAMECNVIRPFFQGALDQFYKLGKVVHHPFTNSRDTVPEDCSMSTFKNPSPGEHSTCAFLCHHLQDSESVSFQMEVQAQGSESQR